MHKSVNITSTVMNALHKHDIIKDLFPLKSQVKLSGNLAIEYPAPNATVSMGNSLSTGLITELPKVYYAANKDTLLDLNYKYTLVFTDPDAPSKRDHKWSEFCHFVTTGIEFENCEGGLINFKNSHLLMSYCSPSPPKNTGPHRYVWLLFKEPLNNNLGDFTLINDRPNWGFGKPSMGVERWSRENNLTLLAVNFFFAEFDANK